jgi:hypothetical protein
MKARAQPTVVAGVVVPHSDGVGTGVRLSLLQASARVRSPEHYAGVGVSLETACLCVVDATARPGYKRSCTRRQNARRSVRSSLAHHPDPGRFHDGRRSRSGRPSDRTRRRADRASLEPFGRPQTAADALFRPGLDHWGLGRRSERHRDLFASGCPVRLRHDLALALHLAADGRHSGDQRQDRTGHGRRC